MATDEHSPSAAPAPPANAQQVARTEVAVGILQRADNALLLTTRPAGKAYPGYWEFPGGKLERGETVEQALRRELDEELGIVIDSAQVLEVTEYDYPHALVRLHWCLVRAWQGQLLMREGQTHAWQQFPLTVQPILPGAWPLLRRIAAQRGVSELTAYPINPS